MQDQRFGKEQFSRFGRMNDPTGSSFVRGQCGDEMEFYLYIRDQIVEDARFYTEGCDDTKSCGQIVAEKCLGRPVMAALKISPDAVLAEQPDLPGSGRHCAILAVMALYKAVVDYLLKP